MRGSALLRPRASSWLAMGVSRPSAAMPVGRPAFLVPRFFAVGDGRFATCGRDAGRKTGVPGPALLRGGRWEVRGLRPRCRMPVGRPAFLVPRFFAVGDGRFATSGRDAGRKTGVPGPALLRGGRWEVRDLRPRCRSEDRRSWSRASSRWAMGGSRPPAAMPVGRPAFLVPRFFAVGDGRFATSGRDAGLKTGVPGPALLRGGRWEVRGLRPRCRSEDRRSWSRASSRWAMGGSRPPAAMPVGRPAFLVPRFFAVGGRVPVDGRGSRPSAAMPVGRPALLVPRFFAVGDGRFAASGRDAGRKTGAPGPALLRGGRWEVRDLRPRCRSEDRRSWSRASSRWAMGGSRPSAAMPVGRPAFLVPRFFAVGDGRFATCGRDAGRKTGVPGPALLRGGRWEVRGLRPRCRSEDRRSWSRASSRWAMGGSRPAAAMPV